MRRSKPKQYSFERLVTSYQSFLYKNPELNKDNIIAKQLMEETVLDANEDDLNKNFEDFTEYFKLYTELDEKCFNKYNQPGQSVQGNWFATENVMNSFFAAISDFSKNKERVERLKTALNKLRLDMDTLFDPIGFEIYDPIIKAIPPKKVNVGVATRKLLFSGFKEFFREEGEKSLADCWQSEV